MAFGLMRAGLIHNPNSHANRRAGGPPSAASAAMLFAEPATPQALAAELNRFAAAGVDLLVIDGGDGTVREVLTALPEAFGEHPPQLAVLPSGKTNILALDLGAKPGWGLETALANAARPGAEPKIRMPLEVSWNDDCRPPLRGFVFGTGAFVRATRLSRAVNRMGAFHSASVALTLAGAVMGTVAGGRRDQWRQGADLTLDLDGGPRLEGARFLMMATTLKRLPFGLRPFGPPREEMKVLDVDAPPHRLLAALPALLAGRDAPWLMQSGYRRSEAEVLNLTLADDVVLDGEIYPGGALTIRRGPALRFVAP